MANKYEIDLIEKQIAEIKKAGYTVYLAERKTHGFFTKDGNRIISFELGLGGITFSGNYRSKKRGAGTGWKIAEGFKTSDKLDELYNAAPPHEYVGNVWHYTTVEENLKMYNDSSKYTII